MGYEWLKGSYATTLVDMGSNGQSANREHVADQEQTLLIKGCFLSS